VQPEENFAAFGMPAAFHPAGQMLVWQEDDPHSLKVGGPGLRRRDDCQRAVACIIHEDWSRRGENPELALYSTGFSIQLQPTVRFLRKSCSWRFGWTLRQTTLFMNNPG
jgi:hypothetical protein